VIDFRLAGYDVVSIAEKMPGSDDDAVIEFARSERRPMVTEGVRISDSSCLLPPNRE
jgi:hypothetical protein